MSFKSPAQPREKSRKWYPRALMALIVALNAGVIWYHGNPFEKFNPTRDGSKKTAEPAEVAAPAPSAVVKEDPYDVPDPLSVVSGDTIAEKRVVLKRGQLLAHALRDVGISRQDVGRAISSLRTLVNFRRLMPGQVIDVKAENDGALLSLGLDRDPLTRIETSREVNGWSPTVTKKQIETITDHIYGKIESSLWMAMVAAGERAPLVNDFVDIFAWEVDFYREVQPGDAFRIVVEKEYVAGEFYGYGSVIAAEFESQGHRFQAFKYKTADGRTAYYDQDGQSLQKQLLRSPLKYGRVTSGFGRRRHPVLGYTRAHNGVDYGVPEGTPVWSVGDGRVVRAGRHGGFGKLVEVRHANGWVSQYAHLSRIDVKVGERVFQKETVGRVGSTGMSTGPHLHYGLKRQGRYVNPSRQKFERGRSLVGADREAFLGALASLRAQLRNIEFAHEQLKANSPG